ncbi:DinB family protein [Ornithinimicrobium cryptoxanthini]|uniref:DinB family protein n=1 Tax=Ornithinimicrobium cryptoxanthini TaxID=2934161 RepID=A0ABY4YJW1_9MICO|nr:DinB family protein [Ornithinimicrobium cryptoxanthini]USQ76821.1 DinB family protein [Ornithinimicrobium cryptoxanthini]
MNAPDQKETLHRYLKNAREALLWKLDGLDDYDVRRPMTPTGTNLLGLVKHVASVGVGYLGDVFDRPSGIDLPWFADDAEPNADLWVPAQESREQVIDLHHRAWAHADATVEALDLDAEGAVPWWGERGQVTLHQILVHITTETHRHAGHADIIRELIDGAVGVREGMDNMWTGDADDYWPQHRGRIEEAARAARQHATGSDGAT